MTSPTQPPKRSLRDSISHRLSTDRSGRYIDAEARHTRNVTWAFYALIVVAAVIAIAGLAYGLWEGNFKPLANVGGTEVSRGEWQDRMRLESFRADRADTRVRAALAEGTIDEDLASRRLSAIAGDFPQEPSDVMEELVDLLFQEQLAEEQGITLSADELTAALEADGTLPEARRVSALVVSAGGQGATFPATSTDRAEARARAEEARAALEAGTPVADLVEEYSPLTADNGGDIGYLTKDDITDPAWAESLFSVEAGGISDIIETDTGEMLIGVVTDIGAAEPDPGFLEAVADAVGEEVHRRNVELEALGAKLEAAITERVVGAEYEQVKLGQIFVEGETYLEPEQDTGEVRVSHILYQPEPAEPAESPSAADATYAPGETPGVDDGGIADDDPAWDVAQAEADQAAAELRAIEDVEARVEAFADRARTDSDGPTGPNGGDLGFFRRDDMVAEFADVVFDAEDPQHGDILGPVRTDFGWHVIMYDEARGPLSERLEAVKAALAEDGADFAAIAAEMSDGPEASDGGDTGWHVVEDLDELLVAALEAIEVGEVTEPMDDGDGYRFYQKQDEAVRPLEPAARAARAEYAFEDWFTDLRFSAEGANEISIDRSVYDETEMTLYGG